LRPSQKAILGHILDLAVKGQGAEGTVCELGCAPGAMIARMAKVRPDRRFHGLDYSEDGLARTREFLDTSGIHPELRCADYMNDEPDRLFDLVVSFGLLEHADNPGEAVRRHMAFARPGGYVAISVPNYGHPFAQWMATRIDPRVFASHNLSVMDAGVLDELLGQAGLTEVRVEQTGRAKLRTSCVERTPRRLVWRSVAKLWNVFSRCLPAGFPWSTTLWAIGKLSPEREATAIR